MIGALLLLAASQAASTDGFVERSIYDNGSMNLSYLCVDQGKAAYWYQVDIGIEPRRNVLFFRKVEAKGAVIKREETVRNSLAFAIKADGDANIFRFTIQPSSGSTLNATLTYRGIPTSAAAKVDGLELACSRTPVTPILVEQLAKTPEVNVQ